MEIVFAQYARQTIDVSSRVCNIRPLFQIRIFGYFSRQIRISGFYPDFLVQVRIGPYIPFSNCDTGDVGLLMKIEMQ